MKKKLYRSTDDVIIAGVVAGVAEYFDQDPTIWRLGVILLAVLTIGLPGIFFYLIAWVVVPSRPASDGIHDVVYTVHE